jgi:hypothetical protein
MAHLYFLMLTLLQLIEAINPVYTPVPSMLMPLLFVVGVSMIKDAYEDYGRAKQDKVENELMIENCARGQQEFQ